MSLYSTKFKLTVPAEFDDTGQNENAKDYLANETSEMTNILINDMNNDYKKYKNNGKTLEINKIQKISWNLNDDYQTGYIHLVTKKNINKETLNYVSKFILGQHSDGLGETFDKFSGGEPFKWPNSVTYHMQSANFDYNNQKYKLTKITVKE